VEREHIVRLQDNLHRRLTAQHLVTVEVVRHG
jgi:hypothetical protein